VIATLIDPSLGDLHGTVVGIGDVRHRKKEDRPPARVGVVSHPTGTTQPHSLLEHRIKTQPSSYSACPHRDSGASSDKIYGGIWKRVFRQEGVGDGKGKGKYETGMERERMGHKWNGRGRKGRKSVKKGSRGERLPYTELHCHRLSRPPGGGRESWNCRRIPKRSRIIIIIKNFNGVRTSAVINRQEIQR